MSEIKQFSSNTGDAAGALKQSGRAKFAYPYFDMDASLEVAKVVHEKGGGSCTPDQLAAFLGYKSIKSGTYQTRTSAARQFGFVRSENGTITIADRAQKILTPVMPQDALEAKTDAFLSVELFREIYEKYQGTTLPPEIGLKNLLSQSYGFSKDRAGPAIRVLIESAEQAGFFAASGDRSRLIKPAIKGSEHAKHKNPSGQQQPPEERHKPPTGGGGEPPGVPGVHSAIIGLLRELPAPGSPWAKAKKKAFKTAFEATLDFIYPTDDDEGGEGGNK